MKNEEVKIDFLQEISNYIFTTKYARYNEKIQRRETWDEAVDRTLNMHLTKYGFLSEQDKKEIEWAFSLVKEKRVVPSMRSLQFAGKAVFAHEPRIFNCAVRHVDSLRSFSEIFYLLLCGCGVGIGLSRFFLNRLPDLVGSGDKTGTVITYVIEDSIEGWSDSVESLLNCYFKNTPYTGRKIVFDYSRIRPAGAPLKTGGGKAPGYKGLKNCHKKIKILLDHIIEYNGQKRLKSINAYDILMHCADAVLSGGVRRSACSVIFDEDDGDMLNAKTFKKVDRVYSFNESKEIILGGKSVQLFEGVVKFEGTKYEVELDKWELDTLKEKKEISWRHLFPQRARSNNSTLLLRKKVTKESFQKTIERTKQFGEPGFVFADHEWTLFNPCFTIDTKVLTQDGWRTFEDLLGKEILIAQDKRVKGDIVDGKEVWFIDEKKNGIEFNKATKICKTGQNQEVFRLITSCGRTVKTTANHHFATPTGMIELKNLKKGDKIFVPVGEVFEPEITSEDFNEGFIAGLIFGDGCFSKNGVIVDLWESDSNQVSKIEAIIHKIVKKDKDRQFNRHLPVFSVCQETPEYKKYRLHSASLSRVLGEKGFTKSNLEWLHFTTVTFKAGFISGLFYSDGHIDFNKKTKCLSLRITNNQLALNELSLICQELGIFSRVYPLLGARKTMLPDGKGGQKEYECKPTFRLVISGLDNVISAASFLFYLNPKIDIFKEICNTLNFNSHNTLQYVTKVKSIVYAGKEDVYCLEENVNRTLIAQGVTARRCFEISFIPVTEDGVCGCQFCNLTSLNGRLIDSVEKFKECVKAYTIIGTLQAGYTKFPYLSKAAEQLTKEESLLGCSITGMMDNPNILLDSKIQKTMAEYAKEVNKEWASKIKINPAARITCIKPEGTSSLVLNTGSGIHPHHSRRYFRRVQNNTLDNVYKYFKKHNPKLCEPSVWSENKTDDIITFPIEVPNAAMVKQDLTAIQHLEIIKSTQQNWVIPGTTEYNKKPIQHNVSCTVIVKNSEWDEVINYLYNNREFFAAVSLLPETGDKDYPQAPMEAVVTEEDRKKWDNITSSFKPVDYTKLSESDDKTNLQQEMSCFGGACQVI